MYEASADRCCLLPNKIGDGCDNLGCMKPVLTDVAYFPRRLVMVDNFGCMKPVLTDVAYFPTRLVMVVIIRLYEVSADRCCILPNKIGDQWL